MTYTTQDHIDFLKQFKHLDSFKNTTKKFKDAPDIPIAVMIHNKYDKARSGIKKMLIHRWGLADNKDERQPDYIERITRFNNTQYDRD